MVNFLNHSAPLSPFKFSILSSSSQANSSSRSQGLSPASEGFRSPSKPDLIRYWDNEQVKEWLESIKCGAYATLFEENHITGEVLLDCDQAILKEIGIKKVGDRVRISLAINTLILKNPTKPNKQKSLHQLDEQCVSPFVYSATSNNYSPVDNGYRFTADKSKLTPTFASQGTKQYNSTRSLEGSSVRPQTVTRKSKESVHGILSMDEVKQSTVRFIYVDGQSKMVNIAGCFNAELIKKKALKKIPMKDNPSNWTVFISDSEFGTTTRRVSDSELVTICHSFERSERTRLMICPANSTPTTKQFAKSQQMLLDSVSNNDMNSYHGSSYSLYTSFDNSTNNPIRNVDSYYEGLRPPSELISHNLQEYFPGAERKVLQQTIRNSIRFSNRMSRYPESHRMSVATISTFIKPGKKESSLPSVPQLIPPEITTKHYRESPLPLPPTETPGLEEPLASSHIKDSLFLDSISDEATFHVPNGGKISMERSEISQEGDNRISAISNRVSKMYTEDSAIEPPFTIGECGDEITEEDYLEELLEDKECPSKWIKGALIGSGSFGTVYLGMNALTGELMAVKQVELPSGAEIDQKKQSMIEALQRETNLLRELHHNNIVQYLGSNADGEHLNIYLEYVPGGSVSSMLSSYGSFEEPLIKNFVRQILQGLEYLHGRHIIHRDIKGANVLVDNKGGIKISDFGISKKIEATILTGTSKNRASLQGSVFWMAPEVVKQTAYTLKADIWSLGCLIIEMFTGTHPFPEFNQMQAIFKIGSSISPAIPESCTADARDFLLRTFELDYTKRPTAKDLCSHSFLHVQ
ncbi:Pkinase-domain-containing protein [Nadsonia fulvescens var. elongata DSM 6958]|uniref:mitogen-activated protein kinase kinase kinase n=1 Tax=Nadsonia fulvescens var. elongata DSM 6958 TaxID=857566 RepID=A0A1E3PRS4_9ASCO|nr:Pkinase-domain-containing protein [Nadsonia fulvescens var. elongata DSM 6958]